MTTVTTYAVVAEKENAKPLVIDLFSTRQEARKTKMEFGGHAQGVKIVKLTGNTVIR